MHIPEQFIDKNTSMYLKKTVLHKRDKEIHNFYGLFITLFFCLMHTINIYWKSNNTMHDFNKRIRLNTEYYTNLNYYYINILLHLVLFYIHSTLQYAYEVFIYKKVQLFYLKTTEKLNK